MIALIGIVAIIAVLSVIGLVLNVADAVMGCILSIIGLFVWTAFIGILIMCM